MNWKVRWMDEKVSLMDWKVWGTEQKVDGIELNFWVFYWHVLSLRDELKDLFWIEWFGCKDLGDGLKGLGDKLKG